VAVKARGDAFESKPRLRREAYNLFLFHMCDEDTS